MHHPTVVHRRPVRQPHGAPARAFSWVPPASSVHWTQKATLAIGLAAKPQWASPPREGKFTPADAAKFVICDDTIELTIKELKSGRHLGQMQVTKEAERVRRSVALSVVAYLLLVRLYGGDQGLAKEWSLFKLKEHCIGEVAQEAVLRAERKWHRKLQHFKQIAS